MTPGDSLSVATRAPVEYGSEAFVEMLNANDVGCLFINSGTDTFPIQEAIAKYMELGRRTPRVVLCPDEATAIAAAHGYFDVTRRPQVVLVHVDSGTMQLGGGMHNAQRGRAGIVLCAGRAPMTFDGELVGSKNLSIHWIQEQLDQAGAMRTFTKWDYELRRTENVQHVMQRAFQVASSEPPGPVYMMLPREVLMESMDGMEVPPVARHGPATTPQADAGAIERSAETLVRAHSPLIITGQSGRNPATVGAMVQLAEATGAPVVSDPTFVNFPTDHALYAGGNAEPYIEEADAILIVDQDVPYIPAHVKPRSDARIIQIDIDPIKETIPLWVFPADQLIHADSSKAVPALVEAVNGLMTRADRARVDERYELIRDRHASRRQAQEQLALSHARRSPITPEWLSYCMNEVLDQDAVIMEECVTNSGAVTSYVRRSEPATYYKSGGSSLGWALGAAFGAKLATPERTFVSLVGDGSFIYGCPTSTLWAADVYDAPFLTVIFNNQIHNAPKRSLLGAYSDSYSARTDNWIGMELSPSVEFSLLAEACHAYGEKVEDPAEVKPALERGLQQVEGGRPAVLDVRIERP